MKDLLLCVHVVIETLKLEISHCHLADYIKEFYLSACRTCSTIILPHSINQIIFWSLLSLSLSCLSSQLIILSGVGIFTCEVSGYLVLRSSLIALLNCSWQWYHRGGHREDCQSPMAESGWFDWQVQEKVRTSEGKILIWNLLVTGYFKCARRGTSFAIQVQKSGGMGHESFRETQISSDDVICWHNPLACRSNFLLS